MCPASSWVRGIKQRNRVGGRIIQLSLYSLLLLASWLQAADNSNDPNARQSAKVLDLLNPPSKADWQTLAAYSNTLTRKQFESRLQAIFDSTGALKPFLKISDSCVTVFSSTDANREILAKIDFAASDEQIKAAPESFRTPEEFAKTDHSSGQPLAGLRVVIEPADIGGKWGDMEDRSTFYPKFGLIQEGDINLTLGKVLRDKLAKLGANVFLVRENNEPVSGCQPDDLDPVLDDILKNRRYLLPESYFFDAGYSTKITAWQRKVAKNTLLTKTLEARARAEAARKHYDADLTIVLQHNATPRSTYGALTPINRNIFFVHGAYMPQEIRKDPEQRYRLLLKLLQNITPTEIAVAVKIADQFKQVTGFPPVLYGNSASTRMVTGDNLYVVARNIAFNREHDGPVVVTEPYFMNQQVTLRRLLAGDFDGSKKISGKDYISIYREYADCVAKGIVEAYARKNN
jgi:N-acetylmuramoyl-L-alanine amidase